MSQSPSGKQPRVSSPRAHSAAVSRTSRDVGVSRAGSSRVRAAARSRRSPHISRSPCRRGRLPWRMSDQCPMAWRIPRWRVSSIRASAMSWRVTSLIVMPSILSAGIDKAVGDPETRGTRTRPSSRTAASWSAARPRASTHTMPWALESGRPLSSSAATRQTARSMAPPREWRRRPVAWAPATGDRSKPSKHRARARASHRPMPRRVPEFPSSGGHRLWTPGAYRLQVPPPSVTRRVAVLS